MSNVVQLKASGKAKRRPPAAKPDPDAALIRACIAFAQSVVAYDAAYAVDPTDSTYADPMSRRFLTPLTTALRKIGKLSATTPEGLDAKARVVPVVIRNAAGSPSEPDELQFFVSFAADVRRVLAPIVQERFKAANAVQGSKE